MKNLKEFKELVKRYETIGLEEIERAFILHEQEDFISSVQNSLTGFGKTSTCTLCWVMDDEIDCQDCVYSSQRRTYKVCTIHKTYDAIGEAETPEALLAAYRARAVYMRDLLTKIEI